MTKEQQQLALTAASLLTKAASLLEYSNNLEKEASATADAMISRGMANSNQREFYKDYLVEHPDKIASIKSAFTDIPAPNTGLGEAVIVNNDDKDGMDAFDLAVLG